MATQPVACAFDLDDDGVMQQPVQKRGGDDGIAEDITPFGKASVGCEDHCALFVSCVHQLEEQVCPALGDRQIANLVYYPAGDCKAICREGTISREDLA